MSDNDLMELIAKMREAQKRFDKTRNSLILKISKQIEKQVDKELEKRGIGQEKKELKLF